ARGISERLEREAPGAPETLYLAAEVAFTDGKYARSLEQLAAISARDRAGPPERLRMLVASTEEVTRGFVERKSTGGHFVFLYPPGKDEVLIDLAEEALEAAHRAFEADFGWRSVEPVRVEILPRARDLARVSTLAEREIETTGTIALCKYNKLMIVTPRATLYGYPWLDTLAHEYAHFVVSRLTLDRAPVWLQEGLAKFEETRWRAAPGAVGLAPHETRLLADAVARRALIGFERMYPSIAKLPSAEAAATAFAEVHTFVAWLHSRVGYEGIRSVLARLRERGTAERAIAEVTGEPFATSVLRWEQRLREAPRPTEAESARRAHGPRVRLRRSDKDDDNVGLDALPEERARRHARLGGLLRARGRHDAAVVEYEHALAITGADDPWLGAKLARTYLDLGRLDRAIAVAEPLVARDPDDVGPRATLGAAYLRRGDRARATAHLEAVLRVSPFDPDVRCGLVEVYTQAGDTVRAQREQRACTALGR
ncbi:MAG: tetratricopeptide repeat protein, partial [Myxococcales bacterium]|nr:tetratricopeptide repeat protein [Myxococcales bacterium]